MPHPHKTPETAPGTKEEWKNLPKRHCDNCGLRYKPNRPNSRFHNDNCRKRFHENGGAYLKLKEAIADEVKRQVFLTETCPRCEGKRYYIGKGAERGKRIPCPECVDGRILTEYGRHAITELSRFFLPTDYTAGLVTTPANLTQPVRA